MEFEKICVIGLGYIGLPTASTFAAHGVTVLGVDVNQNILDILQRGDLHIVEPGLRPLFQEAVQNGKLAFANKPAEAQAFLIAVPTPFKNGKLADMRFVVSAAESIVPWLRKGNLVVLESTSPPKTTIDLVQPILEKSGLKAGEDFFLAYSPERVLPGQILRELVENARVIGGINSISAQAGCDLYKIFVRGEIVQTDATTAEMVKLMENTYRDINIAIANEFSRLADRFGIDVWEAISIANRHPRVKILNPGPGVGGHCISVDPWFLVEAAPDITPLVLTARKVNDSQPEFVVDWMEKKADSLKGKKVAALGLSYKPNVDDFRESPAVEIVKLLQERGASVLAYDPFTGKTEIEGITLVSDIASLFGNVDILVVLVAHDQFKNLSPVDWKGNASFPLVFDTVNIWSNTAWMEMPMQYFQLGVADWKNKSS